MAEKDVTKKFLILLIILVALSLVVDLLSFNVLYGIGKEPSATSGELATSPYLDCYTGCMFGSQYECVDECLYDKRATECVCCEWNRVESCRTACGKRARKTPPYC